MKETKYGIDTEKMYTVSIDYENNAEEWWENGGRELWNAFVSPTTWISEQKVIGREVVVFLEVAKQIPGWDAGPEHAKYPFFVTEVD